MLACVRQGHDGYSVNAPYHLDKILNRLSVYDHQAVATALSPALALNTPTVSSVQALWPEKLKQPDIATTTWTPGVPAVNKRSLAL